MPNDLDPHPHDGGNEEEDDATEDALFDFVPEGKLFDDHFFIAQLMRQGIYLALIGCHAHAVRDVHELRAHTIAPAVAPQSVVYRLFLFLAPNCPCILAAVRIDGYYSGVVQLMPMLPVGNVVNGLSGVHVGCHVAVSPGDVRHAVRGLLNVLLLRCVCHHL